MSLGARVVAGTLAALAWVGIGATVSDAQDRSGGASRGVRPGQLHPDLWLPDTEGTLHALSGWGGRKLLVFHFASW